MKKPEVKFPTYTKNELESSCSMLITSLLSTGADEIRLKQNGFYNKEYDINFGDFEIIIKKKEKLKDKDKG